VVGEARMAFTSHADSAFDVCFENNIEDGRLLFFPLIPLLAFDSVGGTDCVIGRHAGLTRSVELDVDIGADARDWSAIQAAEKLKPVEIELRRIEEVVSEIVNQMEYLRSREQKLRDTNESTNERVKYFALAIMATLVGLGGWQVVYLRAYFRFVLSRSVPRRGLSSFLSLKDTNTPPNRSKHLI